MNFPFLHKAIIKEHLSLLISRHLLNLKENSPVLTTSRLKAIETNNPHLYTVFQKKKLLSTKIFIDEITFLDIYEGHYSELYNLRNHSLYDQQILKFKLYPEHREGYCKKIRQVNKKIFIKDKKKILRELFSELKETFNIQYINPYLSHNTN